MLWRFFARLMKIEKFSKVMETFQYCAYLCELKRNPFLKEPIRKTVPLCRPKRFCSPSLPKPAIDFVARHEESITISYRSRRSFFRKVKNPLAPIKKVLRTPKFFIKKMNLIDTLIRFKQLLMRRFGNKSDFRISESYGAQLPGFQGSSQPRRSPLSE